MSKKRSRLEIYLEVLKVIRAGYSKPTNIMYKSNLSWITLQEILGSLVEKGLVAVVEKNGRKLYVITAKGKSVLSSLEEAYTILSV
jgi:predicted transcriptional regulator